MAFYNALEESINTELSIAGNKNVFKGYTKAI